MFYAPHAPHLLAVCYTDVARKRKVHCKSAMDQNTVVVEGGF